MRTVVVIAAHELSRLFKSPLAWIVLAVVEFLLAWFFLLLLNQFMLPSTWKIGRGVTEIVVAGLLQMAGIIVLLIVPFITMRVFSEERRSGTIALLFSSPVRMTELVIGKYLGLLGFFIALFVLIALMPLSLMLGTEPDMLQLSSGLLGLFLLLASFTAIGLFISTLTALPAAAAIMTFAVLFILWMINLAAGTGFEHVQSILSYLSLMNHYNPLVAGIFNTADLFYYLIIIMTFLSLSVWRLDLERLGH